MHDTHIYTTYTYIDMHETIGYTFIHMLKHVLIYVYYVHIYIYVYLYMCQEIKRKRDRERERE